MSLSFLAATASSRLLTRSTLRAAKASNPSAASTPIGSVAATLMPFSGWNSLITLTTMRLKSGVKTNSGCKKRFRVRGSGSIKRGRSGASHNTGYKTRQRVNRLGSSTGVEGKAMEQRVRRLLGVSGK